MMSLLMGNLRVEQQLQRPLLDRRANYLTKVSLIISRRFPLLTDIVCVAVHESDTNALAKKACNVFQLTTTNTVASCVTNVSFYSG